MGETYQIIFSRLRKELAAAKASSSPIQHLVVLLGIPIAYPRLTWLENIFSSPIIAPIKFLHKRFGFGGGFFNHFDGSVDLLDDLDDHYTARTHKKERLFLIHQLQALASEFSVRITSFRSLSTMTTDTWPTLFPLLSSTSRHRRLLQTCLPEEISYIIWTTTRTRL